MYEELYACVSRTLSAGRHPSQLAMQNTPEKLQINAYFGAAQWLREDSGLRTAGKAKTIWESDPVQIQFRSSLPLVRIMDYNGRNRPAHPFIFLCLLAILRSCLFT